MPQGCTLTQLEAVRASDSLAYPISQLVHITLLVLNVFKTIEVAKKIEHRVSSANSRVIRVLISLISHSFFRCCFGSITVLSLSTHFSSLFLRFFFSICVFSWSITKFQGIHMIRSFIYSGCDRLVSAQACIGLRLPQSWALVCKSPRLVSHEGL